MFVFALVGAQGGKFVGPGDVKELGPPCGNERETKSTDSPRIGTLVSCCVLLQVAGCEEARSQNSLQTMDFLVGAVGIEPTTSPV